MISIQRFFAVLFMLLPMFLSATALGQAMPIFNDPLKIKEIEKFTERLDLTTPQKEAVIQEYDQYVLLYSQVRAGEIQKFEDLVTAFAGRFNFMSFKIPERDEIDELITKGKRAMKSIDRVDSNFFDTITDMLTESQQRELKRIRSERSLDAYRILVLEMLAEMNRSARPNMTRLIQYVVEEESVETTATLERYEQRLLRYAEESLAVMIQVIDVALDMVDELGIREMEREEMFMLFMDEDQMADLKSKGNLLIAPLQKQAFEISELNWKTWNTINAQIAEEVRRPLAMLYFNKGFRDAVRGYTSLDKRFEKALNLELLNEGQRQELLSLQGDYETHSFSLATKYAKLLMQAWEFRTIEQREGGVSEFDSAVSLAEKSREKKVKSTLARLDNILGYSLVEILDEQKKQKDTKNYSKDLNAANQNEVAEVQPSAIEDKKVQVTLGGGVDIPKPMNAGFATDIAMQLGLDDGGVDIINALFSDYREKYSVLHEQTVEKSNRFEKDASLALGARLRTRQELTDQASEAVALLDVAFFDDLVVVTDLKRDDQKVTMLEQFRMRKRIFGTTTRFNWSRTPGKILDLVNVFVIDDDLFPLTETGSTLLHNEMLNYHQQADGFFQEVVKAEFDMSHISDAMTLTREMEQSASSAKLAANMQQKWSDLYTTMQLAKQELIRANQQLVSKLLEELPKEDYWTVRTHYSKVAFPRVFEDKGDATKMLAAAEAIQTLGPAQQGELTRLAEQYRTDYWNICESMIELNEAAVLEESSGGRMMSESGIKQQIDKGKLQFERTELNNRIRMRLRMVLNEEQIKQVPGLPPTVTAIAEK